MGLPRGRLRGYGLLLIAAGLRGAIVNDTTEPTLAALARQGVWMKNSHPLFPAFTTVDAPAKAVISAAWATSPTRFQVPDAGDSVAPLLEGDPALGDIAEHFASLTTRAVLPLFAARAAANGLRTVIDRRRVGDTLCFVAAGFLGPYRRAESDAVQRDGELRGLRAAIAPGGDVVIAMHQGGAALMLRPMTPSLGANDLLQ